jgi:6-bladed beta-propeller
MSWILAACGGDQPPTAAPFMIYDSAGISIVENADPVWSEPQWTVSERPVLEVGGPNSEVLLNPTDAIRLADGRILITDDGSQNVRVFSAAGQLLQTIGRQGFGPGEFQSVSQIDHFRLDSLAIYDYMQQQVSLFDVAGRFGRSVRVTTDGFNWVESVVADSMFFMMSPPSPAV